MNIATCSVDERGKSCSDKNSSHYFYKRMSQSFFQKRGTHSYIKYASQFLSYLFQKFCVLSCFVSYICSVVPKQERKTKSESKSGRIYPMFKPHNRSYACCDTAVYRRKSTSTSECTSVKFFCCDKIYDKLDDLYDASYSNRNQKFWDHAHNMV